MKGFIRLKKRHLKICPFIAFLFPLIVYLYTLNPGIGFIDAGELVTVCRTLGIAHPTGYPLFTIIGRIFSFLPIGNIVFRMNILSALLSSFTSLLLYMYFYRISKQPIISLTSSLLFAFSRIVWHQSTSVEVYSVTFLFLALILFVYSHKVKNRILLIAFISGLALANHMIIIVFLIPFFIYILVTKEFISIKTFFLSIAFLVLGVSIYIYLPVRANLHPLLSWGRTVNLERFIWHITGKQYRIWMFTGNKATIFSNFVSFTKLLLFQYTPFLVPFALLGIFCVFKQSKKWAIFLILVFVANMVYGINYEIPDIEPYFVVSVLMYTFFIFYGLLFVLSKKKVLKYFILLLPVFVLACNFFNASERKNFLANDITINLFSSVKENGILITNNWDYYSPALYLKCIEGIRKDIVIVDKELLRRSWYFDYLKKGYPWLIERSKREVDSYLQLLDDFEHSRLKNPIEIQRRFLNMLNSFIDKNIENRPCYITFVDGNDKDAKFIAVNYIKIPEGILYRISKTPDTTYFDYSKFILRGVFTKFPYKDQRTTHNLAVYSELSMKKGIYLLTLCKFHSAIKTFEFAEQWESSSAASFAYQAAAYLFLGKYDTALSYFKRAQQEKQDDKLLFQSIQMLEKGKHEKLKQHFRRLLGIK